MIDNSDLWKKRAAEILQKPRLGGQAVATEAVQFATSMLTALHGPESNQIKEFRARCETIAKQKDRSIAMELIAHAQGAIQNAVAELDAGLIQRLRVAVTGEILAELIGMAKEVLANSTEGAKNVGAVLVAAAYEDLIRRMGEEFARITGRPNLEEVINRLKLTDVLKGGQIGVALSYLKFRNDSLHADWKNVDRSQVESCLAFIESLLVKHFS